MKRIAAGVLGLWLLAGSLLPAGAGECYVTGESYGVAAKGVVVMEATSGLVLYGQDQHRQLPMASTTKIMTALLCLERPDLRRSFVVDPEAIQIEGSSMGLTQGDTVTLWDLAGGMMMASGNDAAQAAAVRIAGNLEGFAALMNQRAQAIGLADTSFVTPSGLDHQDHYSTAYDMALLAREALENPLFLEMCSARRLELCFGNPPYNRSLSNHNRLLQLYEGAIGIKTGFTKKSGRCLVSAATRDGVTLIVVTLDCGDDWDVHARLYDRYFPLVTMEARAAEGRIFVPVTGGTAPQVELVPTREVLWPRVAGWEPKTEMVVFAPNFLYAPVLEGDIVGRMVYYIEDQPVGESPLAAAADVPRLESPSWWERLFAKD